MSGSWRTFYLRHWIARYRGCVADGVHVPNLAILQHQQLYDPEFPRRWRRHVLSWIAGTVAPSGVLPTGEMEIEDTARAAAEAKGLALQHLSAAQLEYWLTRDEIGDLAEPEKLTRILVRSVSQDPAAAIWPVTASDAPSLLNPAIDSIGAVVAAFRRNEEIARSGSGRTVHELRTEKLRYHLADRWGINTDDDRMLTAVARDRGFHRAESAMEAARSFLLSAISVY